MDGVELHYLHRPAAGPAVLCLHGYGAWAYSYRNVLPRLALRGQDAYALDLPGAGLSERWWRLDYGHPAQARRIARWMEAVGLERVTLVAHSLGGNVAAHFALRFPAKVRNLVLVDSLLLPAWPILHFPRPLGLPGLGATACLLLRRLAPVTGAHSLRSAFARPERLPPEVIAGYRRPHRLPGWELGLVGTLRDARRSGLPAGLARLDLPATVIWGARDRWLPPAYGRRIARRLQRARWTEIPDAGHIPQEEQTDAFVAALRG